MTQDTAPRSEHLTLSPTQLRRWMNARKFDEAKLSQVANVELEWLACALSKEAAQPRTIVNQVAEALSVEEDALISRAAPRPLFMPRSEVEASRRPIYRGGIHFYNYYTLPTPPGVVGPVILDILCPAGVLPSLNNGHLEAALTVVLGPGDIMARWGEEDSDEVDTLFAAAGEDRWVCGDSYLEAPFERHSYALASETPSRIISYTVPTALNRFVEELNAHSSSVIDPLACVARASSASMIIYLEMVRRCYTVKALARRARMSVAVIDGVLSGLRTPTPRQADRLSNVLGLPPHLLAQKSAARMRRVHRVQQSLSSNRDFGGIEVASMASCSMYPELSGVCMKVKPGFRGPQLFDRLGSHYYGIAGQVHIETQHGELQTHQLAPGDALWMPPLMPHRLWGDGAIVRMSGATGFGIDEMEALGRIHSPAKVFSRGYKDHNSWGYDLVAP